ncbi:MAG: C1 family peptidase [Thermoguttaceae bacterium]
MDSIDTIALQKTLRDVNARWEAQEVAEARTLGYTPASGEYSLLEREGAALANRRQFLAMAGVAAAYPVQIDWRNHNGDFITSVKDQGSCGSCVAFGCCATVEADEQIKKKNPHLGIDLSEANLFYCPVPGIPTGSCAGGWNPDSALAVFQKRGVVDAACFPYTPGDQPCKLCADWQTRLTKISGWHHITSTSDMKAWVAHYGPVATCFSVYNDFFAYKSGVYHHVSGALAGGHCVCCVGYNDTGRYWICKNSWGPAWGENGFFQIAYGECGIDATMWGVTV